MKVTIEKVDKLVERADVSYEVAKEALETANGDLLDAVIILEREGKLGPKAGQKKVTTYTADKGYAPTVIGQSYGVDGALQTRVEPNFTYGDAAPGQEARTDTGQQSQYTAYSGPQQGQYTGYAHGPQGGYAYGQQTGYAYGQQAGNAYGQPAGPHQYRDESAQFEEGAKKFFSFLGRLIRGGCINYFEVWRKNDRVLYFPVILFLFCLIHWVFWIFLAFLLVGLLCGCRYRFSGPHLGRGSVNETMDKVSDMADDIADDGGGESK